ncbi:fimbrial protein [Cronobacter dublinensis]|uniref:fimbrial protein n=1 Tax=Cronobacter dublinensis TaxID=413497 RepID=UPI000CFC35D5|nr:fimbrial protein [Cronobacter dublinensis]EGT4380129.1 fimbrial protein [Cronobacter dublinensis]EKM6458177.1 fimbrial protein [Cronobacter dublinensis]EKP4478401.1 fimbrial protein [Cronobacter dublinensis]EKY3203686.1 fimbrial protein [Cronobacter dublinensis]ELQ6125345.1 fimbrial protein [Cronobacter dublinensis]
MKRSSHYSLSGAVAAAMLVSTLHTAKADECKLNTAGDHVNLNVPVAVQLPLTTSSAMSGTVLYKKEAPLSLLSGMHKNINMQCLETIRKKLAGRIPGAQSGKNIYATTVNGLGVRITAIYAKPGAGKKEWAFPFTASGMDLSDKTVSTDDISLRLEVIKTGAVTPSGNMDFRIPSLLTLADNSLVVSLTMRIIAAQAHCAIQIASPQIALPPIDAGKLAQGGKEATYPVSVNLNCINTQKASINVEGVTDATTKTIFKNVAKENAAQGVGIEMLYNGSVMSPDEPLNILLPTQQNTFPLPLALRYAKTNAKISGGQVKTQITMRINYL